MFDPVAFHRLATQLVTRNPSEAASRTAASRAYYASFLTAREHTRQDAIRGPEVHHRVVVELHRMKRGDLATRLQALRAVRNEADYETTQTFTAGRARNAVHMAGLILTGFERV